MSFRLDALRHFHCFGHLQGEASVDFKYAPRITAALTTLFHDPQSVFTCLRELREMLPACRKLIDVKHVSLLPFSTDLPSAFQGGVPENSDRIFLLLPEKLMPATQPSKFFHLLARFLNAPDGLTAPEGMTPLDAHCLRRVLHTSFVGQVALELNQLGLAQTVPLRSLLTYVDVAVLRDILEQGVLAAVHLYPKYAEHFSDFEMAMIKEAGFVEAHKLSPLLTGWSTPNELGYIQAIEPSLVQSMQAAIRAYGAEIMHNAPKTESTIRADCEQQFLQALRFRAEPEVWN